MDLDYSLTSVSSLPQALVSADIASAEDYAACRQIMLRASKNYSTASKYLPAEKLPHVEALYALGAPVRSWPTAPRSWGSRS